MWRERGYERGPLRDDVCGIADGTVFGPFTTDKDVLIDFAQSESIPAALAVLEVLKITRCDSARELISFIESPSQNLPPINARDLPAAVRQWLWEYAVNERDIDALRFLDERIPRARAIFDEVETLLSGGYGSVYVMVEVDTAPEICKIGFTDHDVRTRERDLNSSTSQHRRLQLYAYWSLPNARDAERRIFERLAQYRVVNNREFFQLPCEHAVRMIEPLLGFPPQRVTI